MTEQPKLPPVSMWLWFDHETFRCLRALAQNSGTPFDAILSQALNEFGQFSHGQVFPSKQGVQYSLEIDSETHARIRQKAFDTGQSIQVIALDAIRLYLKNHGV